MVEGNIYAIGMPTFQLPPSGQNIPEDVQIYQNIQLNRV